MKFSKATILLASIIFLIQSIGFGQRSLFSQKIKDEKSDIFLKNITVIIRVFFVIFSLFIIVKLNAGNGLSVYQDSSKNIPYQVKYYSSLDGLTQVSVNAMLKDKQGFLWVGTQDGLNRFDGKDFLQFRYNPTDTLGLQGNYIVSLFQDSKDRIWIGTMNKGLSYYEPSTGIFHRINTTSNNKDIINKSNITTVSEDKFGNIWFNSLNYGIFLCNEKGRGSFGITKIKSFENEEQSTGFFISKNQNFYISTNTGKIFVSRISKDGASNFSELKIDAIQGSISCLYILENILWVGTDYGLWQVDLKTFNSVFYDLNTATNKKTGNYMVFTIAPMNNKIWVGTANGAYLLDDMDKYGWYQKNTFFSEKSNNTCLISNNTVNAILPDSNNLVWLGTSKNLNLLDFNIPKFKTLKIWEGNKLNNQVVFAIYKNKHGLWVGTSGGGLNLFQYDKVYYFTNKKTDNKGIASNVVRSIAEDKTGHLWIGTIKGVSIIDLKTFNPDKPEFVTIHTDPQDSTSLSDDFVKNIYIDKNDYVWIATYGKGVNRFIGDIEKKDFRFQHFSHSSSDKNTISSNYINYITQDEKNNYWIATQEGLDKLAFKDNDFKYPEFIVYKYNYEDSTSISESSVLDISIDNNDILWIGTRYGFDRFDPVAGKFHSFFKKDGLSNNLIFSVQEDDLEQIWLGTGKGLSCFNKKDKRFTNYYLRNGIQDNEFNSTAKFKDNEGNLYMGGIGGLTIFYPADLKIHKNSYDIKLTELILKNENHSRVSNLDKIKLSKELSFVDKLELKYNDFPLFLKFASPKANPLHLPNYYYKLYPLDNEWNALNDRNEIQLLNLSPGEYSLYLTGGYFGKIWDRKPKIIEIIISPPWWKTIWAYFFYFLILFGLSLLIFRLIYRRKLALEETKKWQHIEEMKSQFYTNITHEFRTPLTVILGMVEQVKSNYDLFGKKSVSDSLKMIKRNGIKLLDLVNQLLDMAKIEDGKYQIINSKGDIVWFLGFMVENFHSYAQSKNIQLIFYPEIEKLIMDFDPKAMERIFSNLLGNAIKFSNKGGKVIVHLVEININNKSMLQIKVKDEGIGIEKSKLPYVFDRFYQTDAGSERRNEGTGIGLSMVKNLVGLMNGNISIDSKIGKGSIFTLVFPITTVSLKSAEEFRQAEPLIVEDKNIITTSDNDDNKDLVLIVEDNRDIAKYISSSISDRYAIKYAENGDLGLNLAINTVPDIIISDVMMPVMNGYEMLEKLKKDIRTSHIPIVMLTSRVTKEDKLKGLKYGADAYLTKPFNVEELNVRLEQLILLRKNLQEKYKDPDNWVKVKRNRSKNIEQEFLSKIKEKINDNIDNTSLNPEFLAKLMQMSDTQLYRKLKALTDKSTAIFIRYVRIQKSKELLETTDLNISEIAYDIGFNDPAYFSRIFKDEYGLSPSEVRFRKG